MSGTQGFAERADRKGRVGNSARSLRTVGVAMLVIVALSACLPARTDGQAPVAGAYTNEETGAAVLLEADGTFAISDLPLEALGMLEDEESGGGVGSVSLSGAWEDAHYDPTVGAADFVYLTPDESMPTTSAGIQLFFRSDNEVYLWVGPAAADRFTFLRDD